jgi:hypothetical protein
MDAGKIMTTQEELLDRLDESRERLLVSLEALPDEALVTPGVIGRWSIADLLSILTAWDAEVVTGLMRMEQGKRPERLLAAVDNPSAYNAERFQDAQGRDLDTVFEDFQGSRLHLEDWIGNLSDRALTDPRHYKPLGGVALGQLIAQATYEHEARYLPFLQSFADRWEPLEPTGQDLIEPATIGILNPDHLSDEAYGNGDAPWEYENDDDDDDDEIDFA